MRKIFRSIGTTLYVLAFLFIVLNNFIVTGKGGEDFTRDIFGLPIPHPPLWISYIPYLGFLIGYLFEFLSIHGLVTIVIFIVIIFIANLFYKNGDKD